MGLSWTIVFSVLIVGLIIIPGVVFLTNIRRIRKEEVEIICLKNSQFFSSLFTGLLNSFLASAILNDIKITPNSIHIRKSC